MNSTVFVLLGLLMVVLDFFSGNHELGRRMKQR
jgi:hypothetical protein